jgi:hypothetical protein
VRRNWPRYRITDAPQLLTEPTEPIQFQEWLVNLERKNRT